jgi:hypothetical protein
VRSQQILGEERTGSSLSVRVPSDIAVCESRDKGLEPEQSAKTLKSTSGLSGFRDQRFIYRWSCWGAVGVSSMPTTFPTEETRLLLPKASMQISISMLPAHRFRSDPSGAGVDIISSLQSAVSPLKRPTVYSFSICRMRAPNARLGQAQASSFQVLTIL